MFSGKEAEDEVLASGEKVTEQVRVPLHMLKNMLPFLLSVKVKSENHKEASWSQDLCSSKLGSVWRTKQNVFRICLTSNG